LSRLGILIDQPLDRIRSVAVGEAAGDALARQDVREQRVRCSVQLRHRDDIAAAIGDVHKGEMQGGLSGCDRECADAAFELGDALFEHRGGGVGDPRIAITFGLEIEQGGAVIGAVKGVGDSLIDRHCDRLGRGIGVVAGVNCKGLVAHGPPLLFWRHAFHHAFYFTPLPHSGFKRGSSTQQ
jgi:hypothetical protein